MSAAKTKIKTKTGVKTKTKAKSKAPKIQRAQSRTAGPDTGRPFRFNAAQTVQIRFESEPKPESFRVDDMAEAALVALDGSTKLYFQYRLVSNDKKDRDGADRYFWFFDPKPVGVADLVDPSLWLPVSEQPLDGFEVLQQHSGHFSTRSVTSYDGSGARHVVKLDDKPTYRMQLDLNGKRDFSESRPVTIRKNDVLFVPGSGR